MAIKSDLEKKALFPGIFDPITKGHIEIIKLIVGIFDTVYIGIGQNYNKRNTLFTMEERMHLISEAIGDSGIKSGNIKIIKYNTATYVQCGMLGIKYVVRGIRSVEDYSRESQIADMNKEHDVHTIFIPSNLSHISSSLVKELAFVGSDLSAIVPSNVNLALTEKMLHIRENGD